MSISLGCPAGAEIYLSLKKNEEGACFIFHMRQDYVTIINAMAVMAMNLDVMKRVNRAVRVVSGSAKGRPLKSVPGMSTRPTTDKVKEAIFSMIGPYFDGGTVLDLFAGTGGLGIEALSRGMDRAVFIDVEQRSIETIKDNLKAVRLQEAAEVYRNDAARALKVLEKRGAAFDLVFLDPPYKFKNGDELMNDMAERKLLREGAVIVLEYESGYEYPESFGHFHGMRTARYGETAVTIYRYETVQGQAAGADEEESHDDNRE
jgi:16S rRNA (guanine966-N2)-methyltransferase